MIRELSKHAFTIGVLTEPLATNPWSGGRDLQERRRNYLRGRDVSMDWMMCAVPNYVGPLDKIFRIDSVSPLPVNDAIFRNDSLMIPDPSTGVFVGQVTERRRLFLQELKSRYSWTVIDHGTQWLDPTPFSIGINIHAGNFSNHEHRIFCHMANGQLVLDEGGGFHYGLFQGIHRLVFRGPESLVALVQAIACDPTPAKRVQLRARREVERYRSSRVWPRIILNALARRGVS